MKRFLLIALCLMAASPALFAKGEGTTAASFLKIDTGARPASMAGTFCAFSGEVNSISYNPAGLADIRMNEIAFTHNEWVEGIRSEFFAFALPLRSGALAFSVNYLYMDGLIGRDSYGDLTGRKFGAASGAVTAAYARKLNRSLLAGISLKAINESVQDKSGMAYALDAGLLYKERRFKIGAALQNLGSGVKLNEDEFALPLNLKAGAVYRLTDLWNLALDGNQALAGTFDARFGTEYLISGLGYLRAGYRFNASVNTGPGITAGFGFMFDNLRLDYAFLPAGDFGGAHRISLDFRFKTAARKKSVNSSDQ